MARQMSTYLPNPSSTDSGPGAPRWGAYQLRSWYGGGATTSTIGPTLGVLIVVDLQKDTWFRSWADQWSRETAHLSSHSTRRRHPAYQQIIGLGRAAIPMLLGELQHHPDFWFSALRELTGEDPVEDHMRGKFDEMRDAWLEWARRKQITPRNVRPNLP